MRTLTFTLLALASPLALATYAQAQLQYVPVAPCRAVDTRTLSPIQGGTVSVYNLTACPSPQGAVSAYAVNVTVVPRGPLNYVTIWGTGAQPVSSTLNSYDGRVKANFALVQSTGQVSVFASNTTDIILDVSGYFIPAPQTGEAMLFTPVTPCRLLDTRNATGALGGPYLAANQTRTFPLAGVCNLPASASVLSVNVTAVPHQPLGYLTVWGGTGARPAPSTLNSNTGTTVANAAFITGQSLSAMGNGDTDLIVDVNGYFSQTATGMAYYPTVPTRLLDTRLSIGAFVGQKTIQLTKSPTVFVLNSTVVPQGNLGFLTMWPDGTTQPTVSTLNALDGQVSSNMAVVVTGTTGSFDAYADGLTNLIVDWEGSFMTRPMADPVVFIGDDISAGLVEAANDQTWTCYNCMASTTSTVAVTELAEIIAMKPNAVHILVGAHELSGLCGTEPCDSGSIPLGNIEAMVNQLQAAKIPVVVGTMPPCTGIDSYRLDLALGIVFDNSYGNTPQYASVPLIGYSGIGPASTVCAGPFLPSVTGYGLMIPLAQAAIATAEE